MLFKKYIDKSKMEDFIKVPKFYLSLMAVWPLGKTNWAWIYYLHSFIFAYLLSVLFLISLTIDIYLSKDNLETFIDATYFFMTELTFMIKFLIFTIKRKKFLQILDALEHPIFNAYTPNQKKYLDAWSTLASGYSHAFFGSCYLCFLFFGTFPLFDNDENIILPFRGWFPFDVKTNINNRRIVYIFQLMGLLIAIFINASLDVLPSIFMNVASSQIEILKDNLENAINTGDKIYKRLHLNNHLLAYTTLTENEEIDVKNTLKNCVIHHETINR